ncbi:MAG TPA: hypothetical protein VF629_10745 [Hymenobacter sp.]|jgi:hypothetical protein|uniref:hypothetical protein n=1 Tax=Hymenobacter sp. TaxID=1898978 RepID=UPI002EDA1074
MEPFEEAIQLLVSKRQLLEEQRQAIEAQIYKMQAAIDVLGGKTPVAAREEPEENDEHEYLSSGRQMSLLDRYPDAKEVLNHPYNPHANWRDRVLHALAAMGPAYVPQIAGYILDHQSELEPEFVRRKVTRIASDLSAMHVIKSEREGTRNRYSL